MTHLYFEILNDDLWQDFLEYKSCLDDGAPKEAAKKLGDIISLYNLLSDPSKKEQVNSPKTIMDLVDCVSFQTTVSDQGLLKIDKRDKRHEDAELYDLIEEICNGLYQFVEEEVRLLSSAEYGLITEKEIYPVATKEGKASPTSDKIDGKQTYFEIKDKILFQEFCAFDTAQKNKDEVEAMSIIRRIAENYNLLPEKNENQPSRRAKTLLDSITFHRAHHNPERGFLIVHSYQEENDKFNFLSQFCVKLDKLEEDTGDVKALTDDDYHAQVMQRNLPALLEKQKPDHIKKYWCVPYSPNDFSYIRDACENYQKSDRSTQNTYLVDFLKNKNLLSKNKNQTRLAHARFIRESWRFDLLSKKEGERAFREKFSFEVNMTDLAHRAVIEDKAFGYNVYRDLSWGLMRQDFSDSFLEEDGRVPRVLEDDKIVDQVQYWRFKHDPEGKKSAKLYTMVKEGWHYARQEEAPSKNKATSLNVVHEEMKAFLKTCSIMDEEENTPITEFVKTIHLFTSKDRKTTGFAFDARMTKNKDVQATIKRAYQNNNFQSLFERFSP